MHPVNIMGTLNVLECAAKVQARKVIYAASGGTIYGEPKRLPAKESAAQASHPLSPYGISKKVAVDYLGFFQRYRGLDFTALALANVYGPRQDPLGEAGVVAVFADKMITNEPVTIFGDGNQTRDYVFIDDAIHAFVQSFERGSGKLVNIGTGLESSVNHVFRTLADITGYEKDPEFGPAPAGRAAAHRAGHRRGRQRHRVEAVDAPGGRPRRDGGVPEGDLSLSYSIAPTKRSTRVQASSHASLKSPDFLSKNECGAPG
jgi:UDP-glucose 4-epimerase